MTPPDTQQPGPADPNGNHQSDDSHRGAGAVPAPARGYALCLGGPCHGMLTRIDQHLGHIDLTVPHPDAPTGAPPTTTPDR